VDGAKIDTGMHQDLARNIQATQDQLPEKTRLNIIKIFPPRLQGEARIRRLMLLNSGVI
jgi:hypothetical protein